MKRSSRDFGGDCNSTGDCVLCSSMLEDGKCGVCGVDQAEAKAIIHDEGQSTFLDLCEFVETSDQSDTKTTSLFRRNVKTITGGLRWKVGKRLRSPFRVWRLIRAEHKRSRKLLAMTDIDYQQLICRAYRTTIIHTAKEEVRRYLIPCAVTTFVSVAVARWLTKGFLWEVLWWPLLLLAFIGILGGPLVYTLTRFKGPMKQGPEVAEVPVFLRLAVMQRVRTPFYLRASFWWPTMIAVSVIVVGQF